MGYSPTGVDSLGCGQRMTSIFTSTFWKSALILALTACQECLMKQWATLMSQECDHGDLCQQAG